MQLIDRLAVVTTLTNQLNGEQCSKHDVMYDEPHTKSIYIINIVTLIFLLEPFNLLYWSFILVYV